jgi:predicted metal-binding membrane protein
MPAEDRSLTERILRRDRWIVMVGLAAMTLLSWAYIMAGAGTGMSVRRMTSASFFPHRLAAMSMDGMAVQPGGWDVSYWIVMLLMWWVMMIAMMTPSAAPMILLYARATRYAQSRGQLRPGAVQTPAFAAGYLVAWLGFSLAATVVMCMLEKAEFTSAVTMSSSSRLFSAATLIFAGLYQLSPLKRVCLQRCRNPAAFLARHWRPGVSGAVRTGVEHGFFCIACCWVLMGLLFVGGVMNVLWIGILAIFVILEKIVPHGPRFAWIGGIFLLAWGTLTLVV